MKHYASPRFWELYHQLPPEVQDLADKNFELLRMDPRHKSIRLKIVGEFWSARIGRNYRALAKQKGEGLIWFWIGPHDAYTKLIS